MFSPLGCSSWGTGSAGIGSAKGDPCIASVSWQLPPDNWEPEKRQMVQSERRALQNHLKIPQRVVGLTWSPRAFGWCSCGRNREEGQMPGCNPGGGSPSWEWGGSECVAQQGGLAAIVVALFWFCFHPKCTVVSPWLSFLFVILLCSRMSHFVAVFLTSTWIDDDCYYCVVCKNNIGKTEEWLKSVTVLSSHARGRNSGERLYGLPDKLVWNMALLVLVASHPKWEKKCFLTI